MRKFISLVLVGACVLSNGGYLAEAQSPQIMCATISHQNDCSDMLRGNSQVHCIIVQDSIECAQRIQNGTAHFGIFSAESMLQLAYLDWSELVVAKQLPHRTRQLEPVDFESVVIVRSDHRNGREGLRGKKFCHPGLFSGGSQKWSERFQKHFEREVIVPDCDIDGRESTAEVEASAMARFFSSACRPGRWSLNDDEDKKLKEKYPSLCSLCGTESCSYATHFDGSDDSHKYALSCLEDRGDVAYVSKQEAMNFFKALPTERQEQFSYMCSNGTLHNILDNNNPCVWLRQPWGVIMSHNDISLDVSKSIDYWMSLPSSEIWLDALKRILTSEDRVPKHPLAIQSGRNYIGFYTNTPVRSNPCVSELRWCTTSRDERQKCEVMAAGGVTTGTLPTIVCNEPRESVLDCLGDIRDERADLMAIDSNFGYLARHVYNLTPALYAETENDKFASVAILVHKDAQFNSLSDLRGKKVCMPEFGGIASIALINQLKASELVNRGDCNFGQVLGDFFSESCIPGSRDTLHDPNRIAPENLCNLCRTPIIPPVQAADENADVLPEEPSPDGRSLDGEEDDVENEDGSPPVAGRDPRPIENVYTEEFLYRNLRANCDAVSTNRYYGNAGALQCLDEMGEVAVLEAQFLNDHSRDLKLNPNNYRILCRNGTLADRVGFNVEEDCFLTTIVDSEVVCRRTNSSVSDIINTLLSLDRYFIRDPHFKMYNIYGGTKNLLFKDSTMGLQSAESALYGPKIENYISLFSDVEACGRGAATTIILNVAMTICMFLGAFLVTH